MRRGIEIAKALYSCGCWSAWEDRAGVRLPTDPRDGDELGFADRFLGAPVAEHSCQIHGGPETVDAAPEPRWWTARRCETYGGHRVSSGVCRRCGEPSRGA